MSDVARHDSVGPEFAVGQVERFGRHLVKATGRAADNPRALGSVVSDATDVVAYRLVLDPDCADRELWDTAVLAAQAATAQVICSEPPSDVMREVVVGAPMLVRGLGSGWTANVGDWLAAFWLGVITRQPELLRRLCATPVEVLRSAKGVYADEYNFLLVEAWQRFFQGFGGIQTYHGMQAQLGAAFDATAPGRFSFAAPEAVGKIAVPEINLLGQLLVTSTSDPGSEQWKDSVETFNDTLSAALIDHRDFWSSDADRRIAPNGFLARPLLAIAVLAADTGVPITVSSDYLPVGLLSGGPDSARMAPERGRPPACGEPAAWVGPAIAFFAMVDRVSSKYGASASLERLDQHALRDPLTGTQYGAAPDRFDTIWKLTAADGQIRYLIADSAQVGRPLAIVLGGEPDPQGGLQRYEQGSTPYLRTIMAAMTHRGGDEAALAQQLLTALDQDAVDYVLIRPVLDDHHTLAGTELFPFTLH